MKIIKSHILRSWLRKPNSITIPIHPTFIYRFTMILIKLFCGEWQVKWRHESTDKPVLKDKIGTLIQFSIKLQKDRVGARFVGKDL